MDGAREWGKSKKKKKEKKKAKTEQSKAAWVITQANFYWN